MASPQSAAADAHGRSKYDFWANWGVPIALVLLVGFLSVASPVFLTQANLTTVLQQQAIIALAAIGTTMILIAGGIDLTMGSVVGLTTVLIVMPVVDSAWDLRVTVPLAVGAGVLVGVTNGLLTTKLRIPPIIMALGMLFLVRGVAEVISDNRNLGLVDPPGWFSFLGNGFLGPVPVMSLLVACLYAIGEFVLRFTTFGIHTYAIGSNEASSRLVGINVDRHRLILYAVGGLFSGLAGFELSARLSSGYAQDGLYYEFSILAAILLGGTSIFGGSGSLIRTIVGVLFLGVLGNGMNLLAINSFYQAVATGFALLAAVGLGRLGAKTGG